jgi:aminopeptidase-like protein
MANNELSGPVVTTALALWLGSLKERRFTYRIIFIPETIGSITYLSKNIDHLKNHVIAGFNITCVGDDRCYSYLPSRNGNSISDKAAIHVLKHIDPEFKHYTWLDRGSDERQYCAPGVDLPIACIMRSKYGEYPEYHTSQDNLNLVTPSGLLGGYNALRQAIEIIEKNVKLKTTVLCEPQLGKRGLYPELSIKGSDIGVRSMIDLISYCDGEKTLLEIANLVNKPVWELFPIIRQLINQRLIESKPSISF